MKARLTVSLTVLLEGNSPGSDLDEITGQLDQYLHDFKTEYLETADMSDEDPTITIGEIEVEVT